MKMRMMVILAALSLLAACSKGGESNPEGKPAANNKTVQDPQQGASNSGTATAKPQAAPSVQADKGIRVEKVAEPPKGLAKAAPKARPAQKAAKKVDPKLAAAAAAIKLPAKGSTNPKVEIIEVSDFQCPFCSRVNPTIKQLLEKFGKDLRVRFLHQPLAFHRDAKPAAIASAAAQRQGKFWPYHDKLFANQKALKAANLQQYAQELANAGGFDMEKWKKDVKDPVLAAFVDRNQATAVAVRATGTPMFFVNGKSLRGAQPYPKFAELVEAEIAASKGQAGDTWIGARTKVNNKGLASYVYEGKTPPAAPARPAKKKPRVDRTIYKVAVDANKDGVKGNKFDALVTLVEFSEFQCPFCSKVNPTIDKIMSTYGDKVRVVFKHNPLSFHKDAFPAAEASLCANAQGKFWEYHDKLFQNQRALKADNLEQYAADLGLNLDKFKRCMSSHQFKEQVAADQELAGKVTARGTPNTFVNGRKLTGAQPFENFKTIIDEQLKAAEALVARGIPANRVYAETIKNGKIIEPLGSDVAEFDYKDGNIKGKDSAVVKIVEFSDFQCPYCSRVGKPLMDVVEHYKGKAAVYFKHFPLSFHKEAKPAAIGSLCAKQQGKFWEYHDTVFLGQKQLRGATQDKFVEFAKTAGVKNIAKYTKCLSDPAMSKQVDKDMAEGKKAGVRGTPSVFINGRKFSPMGSGFSLQAFTSVIDKHILK
jgi:protein-disulfide isomerase